MTFIDTHCHLYLPEFKDDLSLIMERARQSGIKKFYLPAIDSSTHAEMLKLENLYPMECFPMMGLHPCSVNENASAELALVEEHLNKKKFAAVGEIGLDFYRDIRFSEQQYDAFNFQMELALKHHLPIIIHSRNAMKACIDTVKPFAQKGLTGIFHCFGESVSLANEIVDMGFYLGMGGVITYKKSGLSEIMKEISLEHIVLETDAPYLTPVPFRGKRNESSFIQYIAQKIAEVKGVTVEEVAAKTTENAEAVFGK